MNTETQPSISGPVVQVASGGYLNLLDPDPDVIRLDDIAKSLSKLCRYTGHTNRFYSVAQHCVLCCRNAPHKSAWAALMHDAAEAYIGDVARPLKQLLPEYKVIEKRIESVIFDKYQVVIDDNVRRLDHEALSTERRDLMPDTDEVWEPTVGYDAWQAPISPWSEWIAQRQFWRMAFNHMPLSVSLRGDWSEI